MSGDEKKYRVMTPSIHLTRCPVTRHPPEAVDGPVVWRLFNDYLRRLAKNEGQRSQP